MGKRWALFFAINMIAMAAFSFAAPALGWWLPEGVSTHAGSVDFLFYVILWVTTFFFFLTEALLIVFIWKYGSGEKPTHLGTVPVFLKPIAGLINTQHKIEMAWTIVPAAILLYIAFAQVGAWAKVKYQSRFEELTKGATPLTLELSARQFEWRFRYPSAQRLRQFLKDPVGTELERKNFARQPHLDDVHVVNELHIWKDYPVLIYLGTRDVLHSFNLPNFRVKQDALPGKIIPVWFTPTKANVFKTKNSDGKWQWHYGYRLETDPQTGRPAPVAGADGRPIPDPAFTWDIPCAELCGWGHWRMVGRVYVHPDQDDFFAWLEQTGQAEHSKSGK
ncbi:MAG: hypothetical protein NZM29_07505 [Nitrospira sp.]|nr:hypothetical protein [Nitrospira sp.]